MDTSEEWKSLWPISSVHSAPLLFPTNDTIESSTKKIGPLIFNPSPHTLTHLFTSPSLSPHLPPPFPNLSLSRFLQTSTPSSSSILPSTCTTITSEFGPQLSNPLLVHNCLQLLHCPGTNLILVFFPTGTNSDQVGFLVLSVENSQLNVKGKVLTSKNMLSHRIVKILVNPLADSCFTSGKNDSCDYSTIGYLLICTTYSIHWYSVKIKGMGSDSVRPVLNFLGSKFFRSCGVVHACWSPHLLEESLVLLESGELFLFDLDSCSTSRKSLPGEKLRVSWDQSVVSEKGGWLSCEFGWHPRVLIVAHSSAVFLVDLRSEGQNLSCLLKIEMLNVNPIENDRFVALSMAGPGRFYFAVASNHLLFLCDLRKPLMPVLRWAHSLASPSYITVFRLTELRSQSKDVKYEWASENGYGIIVGSFWNCEFILFCYGPDVREASESSDKSFYAWGLPSNLQLASSDCHCGSCLVKERFSKDELPDWIDWRQKKEIVLGFGIIDKDLSAELYEEDGFGGFVLIRVTSSGKLESQRYCPSGEYVKNLESSHNEQSLSVEDSLLYGNDEEEYKFRKIYQYLKLDWLHGYLKSTLAKTMHKQLENTHRGLEKKSSFGSEFHENICQKLKTCKFSKSRASLQVQDAFLDISLPTSIHEIALANIWAHLPINALRLGFSTYPELLEVLVKLKKVPLEFLEVPSQPQLPPFSFRKPSSRSSKWSHKHQPGNALVGPVVPLPCLLTFRNIHMEKAEKMSADSEINRQCDNVMRVANEVTMSGFGSLECNDHIVSLADDKEDMLYSSQNTKMFSSYKPVAFSSKFPGKNSVYEDERHTSLIFRVCQKDGPEVFASQCPLKFTFDDPAMSFGPKELKTYKLLKRQYSNFKEGFSTYQEYLTKSNIKV